MAQRTKHEAWEVWDMAGFRWNKFIHILYEVLLYMKIVEAAVLFFGGMTVAQRQKLCDGGYSW